MLGGEGGAPPATNSNRADTGSLIRPGGGGGRRETYAIQGITLLMEAPPEAATGCQPRLPCNYNLARYDFATTTGGAAASRISAPQHALCRPAPRRSEFAVRV